MITDFNVRLIFQTVKCHYCTKNHGTILKDPLPKLASGDNEKIAGPAH